MSSTSKWQHDVQLSCISNFMRVPRSGTDLIALVAHLVVLVLVGATSSKKPKALSFQIGLG